MFKEIQLPINKSHLFEKSTKKEQISRIEEAKNGDLATKNGLIYCDILDLFDKKAKEYKKSKNERRELSLLLFHSYFSQKELQKELNNNPILQTRYSTYELNNIIDTLRPKIETIKKKRNEKELGIKEKVIAAYRVYKKTLGRKDLCEAQRNNLLEVIGYPEEGLRIARNITTSAKFTAALFPAYSGIEAAALGTMLANNWIKVLPFTVNEENLKIALAVSIAADVLSATADAAIDLKLLRNKSIGTSPSLPSTAIYYLLEKFLPERKKTQDLSIILAAVIPTIIQDSIFQPMGPMFAKNVVKSIIQTTESSIKLGYLAWKKKQLTDGKQNEVKRPTF